MCFARPVAMQELEPYCDAILYAWHSGTQAGNAIANIIVMRLVENGPRDNYNSELFIEEYGKLVSYLNGSGKAEIIITTGFWKHIADSAIREYAHKNKHPLVALKQSNF